MTSESSGGGQREVEDDRGRRLGGDQLADEDLGQRGEHRAEQRRHRADRLGGGGACGVDGQPRPEDDHDADEADRDGAEAEDADLLAEEHRGEDHDEQRRGVAEGGGLGQAAAGRGR